MRPTISVGVVWIGLLLMVPGIVLAEKVSTDASATVEATVPSSDQSGGATIETSLSNTVKPTPKKPTLVRESPVKPATLRRDANKVAPKLPEVVNGQRDAAHEKATVRVNEQATRPLPNVAEKRENAQEKRVEREEKRGEVHENVKERRDEARQKIEERRSEILKRVAHQMIGRIKAAIERLVKLADRIDSRIVKLKAKGVDTGVAEANIAIARTKIAEARTEVNVAEEAVVGAIAQAGMIVQDTTPVDAGKPIREALDVARKAVFVAHKAIVDAVVSLKASVKVKTDLDGNVSAVVGAESGGNATTNTTGASENSESAQ